MKYETDRLRRYMYKCINLAKKNSCLVGKPYVGALVISKNEKIVGRGHKSFVGNTSYLMHAERAALTQAGNLAEGGF